VSAKQRIISDLIAVEGGFWDDPTPNGGPTRYGVTERTARRHGYSGDMRQFPRSMAVTIFATEYWDAVRADGLLRVSEQLAAEVVDTCVNCGPSRASEFLQRQLNVLNRRGTLYPDLVVDRNIGPRTIAAVIAYAAVRDVSVLVRGLNCLQGAFYTELCERREVDEDNYYGWLSHRVKL
jgi:lysozyme family protein